MAHPLIRKYIRNRTITKLTRAKPDATRAAAAALVDDVPDDELNDIAAECGCALPAPVVGGPVGAIGDGSILKWITDHLPQILQIIEALVALLLPLL